MFRPEKKFLLRAPPPPVKGKIFDTRFGLIHVQTGKILFCQGTPPPEISRNCYGYAAGGMPLAFTQEDFLVICLYLVRSRSQPYYMNGFLLSVLSEYLQELSESECS